MVTKVSRQQPKFTKVTPTAQAAGAEQRPESESYYDRFMRAELSAAAYEACSAKRKIAAWALAVVASIGVGYVTSTLVGYAMAAVIYLTSSAFLAMIVYIIGVVLSIYASMRAFTAGFNYVISSDCTRHIALVDAGLDKISGLFRRTPSLAS